MITLIVATLSKLLIFTMEILPKTFLEISEYGKFSYNLTQITLLSSLISFGAVNYLLKELPDSNSEQDSFFSSIVLSFFISIIIFFLSGLLDISYVVLISGFMFSILLILTTYFRYHSMTSQWYFFKDILRTGLFIILSGVLFLIKLESDAKLLTELYAISLCISLILVIIILVKKYKFNYELKCSNVLIRFIKSAPIVFTGLSYIFISRIDVFYVKESFGFDGLSDYTFVSRIMYQSLFLMQVIQGKYLHRIAISFSNKENEVALKLSKEVRFKSLFYTTILAFFLIVILNLKYTKVLFNIESEYILELSIVFFVLQVATSYFSLYGYMLLYLNKQNWSILNSVIILTSAFITLPTFISLYGIVGAAIGTSFSILLGNVLEKIQFNYFYKKHENTTYS